MMKKFEEEKLELEIKELKRNWFIRPDNLRLILTITTTLILLFSSQTITPSAIEAKIAISCEEILHCSCSISPNLAA